MNMRSAVLRKVIAVSIAAAMVTGTALCAPVISDVAGTSITVSAAETYGDFEYTVTVTKYKGTSAKVTVPEKINSKTVTVPETVTAIPSYIFNHANMLEKVVLPDTITKIGSSAFENCSSLTSVNVPDSVTSIGDYAFEGCSSLAILKVGTKIEKIGSYAFDSCKKLTIYGKADTYMSTYAANKNIPYVTEFSNLTMVTPKDKVSDTQNFVIMADASGRKTPYTYAVYYKLVSDEKWTTLQGFSSTAKATFNPPYMGDYQLCVKVKDKNGTVEKKYFEVKVS